MCKILLIRHAAHIDLGERLSGRAPQRWLTAAGREQAAALAARLAGLPLAAIYSSPLQRARETAAILAETLLLPVTVDPAFNEIDYGAWTDTRYATLAGDAQWQHWNAHRAVAQVPGGESMADAQARALHRLSRLARQWPESTLAVVSHCDIIRAVLIEYLGRSLDQIHDLDVPPASISRIEVNGNRGRVLGIGEIGGELGGELGVDLGGKFWGEIRA